MEVSMAESSGSVVADTSAAAQRHVRISMNLTRQLVG